MLSQLTSDPIGFLIQLMYTLPAILLALTLHEVSHGYVAHLCGDDTALMLGRLSLNPLKHLDPLGALCLMLFRFGWAKPVPVNPRNFKNFRQDDFFVSIAGITMNLILFLVGIISCVICIKLMFSPDFLQMILNQQKISREMSQYNILIISEAYTSYNYPYLGEMTALGYLARPALQYIYHFLYVFTSLNLSLALFNLLPIPPLDGFHLFNDVIFRGKLNISPKVFRIGMGVLLALSFFTGWISTGISWVMNHVENGLLSVLLPLFGL